MSVLDKNISLKGVESAVSNKARGKYPTKTTINLAQAENAGTNRRFEIISLVAVIVAVLIFAKFAVIDPVSKAVDSDNQVAEARAELAALEKQTAELASISDEYAHYVVSDMNANESVLADRKAIMDLLWDTVLPLGSAQSMQLSGNEAKIIITGAGSSEISEVCAELEKSSLVSYVTVQGASDKETSAGSTTQATVTILFTSPGSAKGGN